MDVTKNYNALCAKARGAAYRQLAINHPEEFDRLLAETRAALSLPPERIKRGTG